MQNDWQLVDTLGKALESHFGPAPEVGIVLGSGLGDVAEMLGDRKTISTAKLDGWPISTVEGHEGALHVGLLNDRRVFVQQGRVHLYEGYGAGDVVLPIRASLAWGMGSLMLTNASGGIDLNLKPGGLMVISDHLNLTGANPLVGPPEDSRGPRFPDMSELYDKEYALVAVKCAANLGIPIAKGVYAGLLGPNYETPAEVRMLATLGAQAVGMSTVLEAIAAKHMGARVAGISCVTNRAAGLPRAVLDHEDVQEMGQKAAKNLASVIAAWSAAIGERSDK